MLHTKIYLYQCWQVQKKEKRKKCYFMYIYISLSSGQTVTTDFMVYGNKGLAREDWEDVSGRGRKDIFM